MSTTAKLYYGEMDEIAEILEGGVELGAADLGALLTNMCKRIHAQNEQINELRDCVRNHASNNDAHSL